MEYLLTKQDVENLKAKLEKLDEEFYKAKEDLKQIVSNDPEYLSNTRYVSLNSRIKHQIPMEKETIRKKLKNAKIIQQDEWSFDGFTVMIGNKVTLDYEGEIEVYRILPVTDKGIETDVISSDSPIAGLILGRKVGDEILHNGINVKILKVEKS